MAYSSYKPPGEEGFGLKRLFRVPIDGLPISEQVKYYKQRNLIDSKLYRIGSSIWGSSSRTRIFDAPYELKKENEPQSKFRSPTVEYDQRRKQEVDKVEDLVTAVNNDSRLPHYRPWLRNRQKMREGLKNMGLNESWLLTKSRNDVEEKVLNRLIESKLKKDPSAAEVIESSEATTPSSKSGRSVALFEILQRISKYLRQTKLRPFDLFTSADKDKNWQISIDEMRNVIKTYNFPMNEYEIELLLNELDVDRNGELDYREFITGLRQSNSDARSKSRSTTIRSIQSVATEADDKSLTTEESNDLASDGSELGNYTRSAVTVSPSIVIPSVIIEHDADLSQNRRGNYTVTEIQPQKEKNSRKEAKAKLAEEQYYKDLYQKATRTTLTGEIKEAIYSQKRLLFEEYKKAVDLCRKNNIKLSKELLERVLLEPYDRAAAICKNEMRQSGTDLISYNQLMGIKKIQKKKMKARFTGIERIFPPRRYVLPIRQVMKLSTGYAEIKSKTDCWMTLEEFERIAVNIPHSKFLVDPPDPDAFWPGEIRHRLNMYLSKATMAANRSSGNILFTIVDKQTRVGPRTNPKHQSYDAWQSKLTTDKGSAYIQYGGLELKKSYIV